MRIPLLEGLERSKVGSLVLTGGNWQIMSQLALIRKEKSMVKQNNVSFSLLNYVENFASVLEIQAMVC